jgi:hypothetical protein
MSDSTSSMADLGSSTHPAPLPSNPTPDPPRTILPFPHLAPLHLLTQSQLASAQSHLLFSQRLISALQDPPSTATFLVSDHPSSRWPTLDKSVVPLSVLVLCVREGSGPGGRNFADAEISGQTRCLFVSLKFGCCRCLCRFVVRGKHCSFAKDTTEIVLQNRVRKKHGYRLKEQERKNFLERLR